MGRHYAKEALRRHRQQRLEEWRGRLSEALTASRTAATVLTEAETARREFERRQEQAEREDRARVEAGPASMADFAASDAWRCDALQTAAGLGAKEHAAKRALVAALEREATARRGLADAEASAKAIERDHEVWVAAQRSLAERVADDELDERWASRYSSRPERVKA